MLTRTGKLESGANAYLYVAGKSGGHGLSTRSSACQALIECFGGAIVGLIEIDTESLAIVPYLSKPAVGVFRKTVLEHLHEHGGCLKRLERIVAQGVRVRVWME